MIRSTRRQSHLFSSLLATLLVLALFALVACGGDSATDASTAEAPVPDTEEVSPEPTYEPAPEVVDPENAEEAGSDEPGATTEEPKPAKSPEPDAS